MKSIALIFLAILLMSYECENDQNESLAQQDVVFMKMYENYAWGHVLSGWVIDNAGNVKAFSMSREEEIDWRRIDENGYISETDAYHNLMLSTKMELTLSLSELNQKFVLIEGASRGALIERDGHAYDMGTFSYYALKFKAEKESYQTILLSSSGDRVIENTSKDAEKILIWLKEIDEEILKLNQN